MSNVAYSARVTMHEAKWTDIEGSTVTFKLPMSEAAERERNPFQKFTKRRKGRAGTRFAMVCYEVQDECQGPMVYKDESMLTGWNDSQSNGHTVKFWLCADGMGHPFDGYDRKKDQFILALIELDDDNETIDQKMRDKVEASSKRPSERLSYAAAMLCKNEGFWSYVKDVDSIVVAASVELDLEADPENWCRDYILMTLDIKSRAELDKSEVLAGRFHEEIRRPFLRWQGHN